MSKIIDVEKYCNNICKGCKTKEHKEKCPLWNAVEYKTDEKKSINEWAKECNEIAEEHGWHDEKRTFGEIIALCHGELSEALEEERNYNPIIYHNFPEVGKPEGKAVEMIDCVIRIFEYLWGEGINIETVMREKCDYNRTREYRHGGKKL